MPNRLARSASPYLLQHGDNPVDWYPWDDEAFERARREDRPVLLSIGYASCHWCHVMARESFEDEEVAALMNERFVCVKVDREERPDIDAVYMSAVQAMTGSGGWPLTVALTPDGAPFFGGTYFPPEDRWGQPSFRRVLEAVSSAWRERRDEVLEAAHGQRERLRGLQGSLRAATGPPEGPREDAGRRALAALASAFDDEHGGFGRAPKFPPHGALRFLLGRPEPEALAMATATLDAMAAGGIHDQLGGGFARYSVDEGWRVPHFEKMLYDNAQLLRAYAEAYARTGDARYRLVCAGIVRWLGRELAAPGGGFYSSLDADSDGSEGRYYTWTEEELAAAAGDDAALAARVYGVRSPGPFEGRNVLRAAEPVESAARASGLGPEEAEVRLQRARRALLSARETRPRPALDDKVLTSWNGLALAGLADAARVLGSGEALEAAHGIVRRVRARAWRDGRLLHAQRGGVAHVEGLLEDYAYLGLGLLALHRLTLEGALLGWALDLAAVVRRDFQHPDGGFYATSTRAEPLPVRPRSLTDASVPSGNAAAAELLATLAAITGDGELAAAAERAVAPLEDAAARQPQALASALSALERLRAPPLEVVLVGDPVGDDTAALVAAWRRRASGPATAILVGGPSDPLALRCPVARGRISLGGRATAYVCRAGACRLPVTDVTAFETELDAAGIAAAASPGEPGAAS